MNKNLELLKALKIFLYAVLVILVFTACASTKHKLVKTSNIQKDTLIAKKERVEIKTINQPISDYVFIPLETGNLKIDSVLSKRLSNFKTYKKSGNNSYKITYKKKRKGFAITSKVGGTENSLVKKNDTLKKIENKEIATKQTTVIVKYRVPYWLWIVFIILMASVYVLSKLRIL